MKIQAAIVTSMCVFCVTLGEIAILTDQSMAFAINAVGGGDCNGSDSEPHDCTRRSTAPPNACEEVQEVIELTPAQCYLDMEFAEETACTDDGCNNETLNVRQNDDIFGCTEIDNCGEE